jgi:hypothetical protein
LRHPRPASMAAMLGLAAGSPLLRRGCWWWWENGVGRSGRCPVKTTGRSRTQEPDGRRTRTAALAFLVRAREAGGRAGPTPSFRGSADGVEAEPAGRLRRARPQEYRRAD